jgi:hypothetical protein
MVMVRPMMERIEQTSVIRDSAWEWAVDTVLVVPDGSCRKEIVRR